MAAWPAIALRRRAVVALAAGLAGARVAPQGSPTVIVADTADGGGAGGGTFFMVTAIEGRAVETTALTASRQASVGRMPGQCPTWLAVGGARGLYIYAP